MSQELFNIVNDRYDNNEVVADFCLCSTCDHEENMDCQHTKGDTPVDIRGRLVGYQHYTDFDPKTIQLKKTDITDCSNESCDDDVFDRRRIFKIPTGTSAFDCTVGGIERGEITLLCGKRSVGLSQFSWKTFFNAIKKKFNGVLIIIQGTASINNINACVEHYLLSNEKLKNAYIFFAYNAADISHVLASIVGNAKQGRMFDIIVLDGLRCGLWNIYPVEQNDVPLIGNLPLICQFAKIAELSSAQSAIIITNRIYGDTSFDSDIIDMNKSLLNINNHLVKNILLLSVIDTGPLSEDDCSIDLGIRILRKYRTNYNICDFAVLLDIGVAYDDESIKDDSAQSSGQSKEVFFTQKSNSPSYLMNTSSNTYCSNKNEQSNNVSVCTNIGSNEIQNVPVKDGDVLRKETDMNDQKVSSTYDVLCELTSDNGADASDSPEMF